MAKYDKSKNKMKDYAIFNGKKYHRSSIHYDTKDEAKRRKKQLKYRGQNAIIDKRKEGYILWTNEGKQKGKKKTIISEKITGKKIIETKKPISLSRYSVNFPYGETSSIHMDIVTTGSNIKNVKERIKKWYPSGFHYVSEPKVKGNTVSVDIDIGGLEPDEFMGRFKVFRKGFKELGVNVKNMKATGTYSDNFIKYHGWKYKKNARKFSG